jgi:hypothetical protein
VIGPIHALRRHICRQTLEAVSGCHPTQNPLQCGVFSQRQR